MNPLAYSRRRLFLLLALIGSIFLAYLSGWREVGIDRDNYYEMYRGVITSDEWMIKLWYAKDVMFLLIATVSSYFSDDAKLAFLIICFFSVFTKYLAIRRIAPRYTLGFILMYTVFLSPGLEFAAMRGAMAIGFLMLALSYRDKELPCILFSFLAMASHISSFLALIFVLGRVNKLLTKHKVGYLVITIGISLLGMTLLGLFPHGADYENNQGTVFAYSEPLATLFIALLIFYRTDKICIQHSTDSVYQFIASLRPVVYGLIAIAFGISAVVVTAATRYLEVSWCLMLFTSIVLFNKSCINLLGGLLLLAFLSYINIIRVTWLAILYPNLG
jgi:hypothetical protein